MLGLSLCAQRNFLYQLVVESDSLVLIQILRNVYQCPWTISYDIEQCRKFSQGSMQFKHCYREANKVADVLANVGCALVESVCIYEHFRDLPSVVRGEYRLDKLSYPSIRRRRVK